MLLAKFAKLDSMNLHFFIINFIIAFIRMIVLGGARKMAAENMALRQQLISLTSELIGRAFMSVLSLDF